MSGRKIVAFSVWGTDPVYTRGAISNLVLRERFYPDWEYVFYLNPARTPETLRLAEEIARRGGSPLFGAPEGHPKRVGLYWRLNALFDPSVDLVLFRDTDSRPSDRESVCVFEWLESGEAVHVMRDHRSHTAPLMGGMWGCCPEALFELVPQETLKASFDARMNYVLNAPMDKSKPRVGHLPFSDQEWLADAVWPHVKDNTFIHDESTAPGRGGHPFSVPRTAPENFVGQAYNVQGVPKWPV